MVESEQSREMGRECFARLREEIAAMSSEDLAAFLVARDPDSMGFSGRKEGI